MLVEWPGIRTEAFQVGYSVILRSVLGAQGCRLPHVFAQQNHPKALPLKLFQCWCFGDISPFPVHFPRDGRPKSLAIPPVNLQILTKWFRQIILPQPYWLRNLKTIFFSSHLYKYGWKLIVFLLFFNSYTYSNRPVKLPILPFNVIQCCSLGIKMNILEGPDRHHNLNQPRTSEQMPLGRKRMKPSLSESTGIFQQKKKKKRNLIHRKLKRQTHGILR